MRSIMAALVGSFAVVSGLAPEAVAQQAGALEEVLVTAQKREQSIQDVSIAITAFSGEQIAQLGLQSSSEVAFFTPGVHIASTSAGQDAQFTIRGVTQTDFSDAIEPPNAVYVDEGYMPTTQGQRFGMFDLERVEVLKGPQGTLFGRNATGGLVHYVTRKPTRELESFAELTYGSYDQVRAEGAVSGPLTERLSARVSGMVSRHDEIIDNDFPLGNVTDTVAGDGPFVPSDVGQDDFFNDYQWAVRGQLLWDVNEDVELLVSGYVAREETGTGQYEQGATTAVLDAQGRHINTIFAADDPLGCEAVSAETGGCLPIDFVDGNFGNTTRPVQGGDLFGFIDPGGRGSREASVDHALDDFNNYEVNGVTARLTWDFRAFTVTSISHYVDFFKEQTLDTDVSPIPQSIVMNDNETETFSQELRLNGEGDRYRWVAGFFFLHIDNENAIGLGFSPDSPITQLFGVGPFESDAFSVLETNSYSLFGQVEFDLTDKLTFITGLRTIFEDKDAEYENLFLPNPNDAQVDRDQDPIVTGLEFAPFDEEKSDTLWAGRIAMEFRPSDDWLLYASINRGVKAGSFNFKLNDFNPGLAPEDIPYDEEVLLAYETGFKSTLFDGRVNLNGTFYYYDYDDYQGFVFSGTSGFVRNVDAKFKGAELELTASPIPGLNLIVNGSWIDAEVTNLEVATNLFRDVEPAHTPEWQAAGLARYEWGQEILGGRISTQLDFNFVDDRFHNIRNFDAHKMDDYVVANWRLAWASNDGRWQGTFFVKNFLDETYQTTGFDLATLCGCNEEAWGAPRWLGGTLRYSWQ